MYSRFYRWASDRVDKNGVIALITNNSFINTKSFDGFRKSIQDEFDFAYVINLGGDIRELSGRDGIFLNEEHTIFGVSAAVGIAIMWLVKIDNQKIKNCAISYIHPCDIRATRKEKFDWLNAVKSFNDINFERITPDKRNNWILSDNNFEELLPLGDKSVKSGDSESALFKLFCWGNSSNRDEWVYSIDRNTLEKKIDYFIDAYNKLVAEKDFSFPDKIKWSSDLKTKFKQLKKLKFDTKKIKTAFWRPFEKTFFYAEKTLNDRLTENHYDVFGEDLEYSNKVMMITNHPQIPFLTHVVDKISDAGYGSRATHNFPLYLYNEKGERMENITKWGHEQFVNHYKDKKIKKEDIFHYVYAVLHNPAYKKKYELNLKRDFPRIPFYKEFWKWSNWGKCKLPLFPGQLKLGFSI